MNPGKFNNTAKKYLGNPYDPSKGSGHPISRHVASLRAICTELNE